MKAVEDYKEYMESALVLALRCRGEPRIGVVITSNNTVLTTAYRGEMRDIQDPVRIAIVKAEEHAVDLGHSTLYITHEPDVSSVDYIVNAQIRRVIIGVRNPESDDAIIELLRKGVNVGRGVLEDKINECIPTTSCPK